MREMQKPVVRWGLSVAAVAVAFLAAGSRRVGAQAPANGAGGPKEGIVVHGHWTIDVRQPDGTLVTHREFENALTGGGTLIANLLARRAITGHWDIYLANMLTGEDAQKYPCSIEVPAGTGNFVGAGCSIGEHGWGTEGPSLFGNLTIAATGFTLSGTATASRVGVIDVVRTGYTACLPGLLVSTCSTPPGPFVSTQFGEFSAATLSSPVAVVPNQLIQASVTYTFSAGETHINP